jgi:hypothetical protein
MQQDAVNWLGQTILDTAFVGTVLGNPTRLLSSFSGSATNRMPSIDELIDHLSPDPWRRGNAFSSDMEECHIVLFDPAQPRANKAQAINRWLASKSQPCLFGRMAAKQNWLSYCVLTELDVARGDEHLRDVIQASRRAWKAEALRGGKHGFVISLVSKTLAYAEPNVLLQQIAQRLCQLYLSRNELNEIFHDELILRISLQDGRHEYRRWKVGVNYFAAQGDGRWWNDHRFPGGVAFSMNSVGHMARKLAEDAIRANRSLAARAADLPSEKLAQWALPLAMRTILTAQSGQTPGTRLAKREACPISPDSLESKRNVSMRDLAEYSEYVYYGWYHTDESIPAEYFDPCEDRPANSAERELVFTYLHDKSDEDYECMGMGEAVLEALELGE